MREFILMRQGYEQRAEMEQKRLAWQTANIMNALGASVSMDDLLKGKDTKPEMTESSFSDFKKRMLA